MFATLLPEPDSPTMPEHLAALDLEREAVDRLDDALVGLEVDLQVLDLRAVLSVAHSYLTLGSR